MSGPPSRKQSSSSTRIPSSPVAAPEAGDDVEAPPPGPAKRVRRVKRPASHTQCDPCGLNNGLQQTALQQWWTTTVSGVWDTATGALGVQQATTSQADVADMLQRTSTSAAPAEQHQENGDVAAHPDGGPAPALRRRRPGKRRDASGGDGGRGANGVTFAKTPTQSSRSHTVGRAPSQRGDDDRAVVTTTSSSAEALESAAVDAGEEAVLDGAAGRGGGQEGQQPEDRRPDGTTPPGGADGAPANLQLSGRRRTYKDTGEEERGKQGVVGDSSFPGLEYLQRIYAPPALMAQYEALERELESPEFAMYTPEEQAEVRQELLDVQMVIEQRENRLNLLFTIVGSLRSMYVGVLASMLTVFVPQQCPPTAKVTDPHTCSLNEVMGLIRSDKFEQAVFALNLFTLLLVLITEYMVFNREKWLDTTLSYNPRRPANNLSAQPPDGGPSLLQQHPYVAHALLWQNITTGNLARTTISMVGLNLIVTSVLILRWHYAGSASVIGLITNTLLLGSRLLYASVICLAGQNPRQGTSLYKVMRVSFNVVDSNFLTSDFYKRHAHRYTWEDVEAEYARMLQAEQGDVQMMAQQARSVLKIVVGRKDALHSSTTRRMARRSQTFEARLAAAVAREAVRDADADAAAAGGGYTADGGPGDAPGEGPPHRRGSPNGDAAPAAAGGSRKTWTPSRTNSKTTWPARQRSGTMDDGQPQQ